MSESAILWMMGGQSAIMLALISIIYVRLSNHEERCLEWQRKFMEEHGALKANIELLLRRLE